MPSSSTATLVSEHRAYTFPMGNLATPQALIARWSELCRDSSLNDLPYKVELNSRGKLELTPRTNRRGLLAAKLACELQQQLPVGMVAISCGVLTANAVRAPDVIWASAPLMNAYKDADLFERAPEICVEVCTPDGEEKVSDYLQAGAKEAWVVGEEGAIRYFDSSGERSQSAFPVTVTLSLPIWALS